MIFYYPFNPQHTVGLLSVENLAYALLERSFSKGCVVQDLQFTPNWFEEKAGSLEGGLYRAGDVDFGGVRIQTPKSIRKSSTPGIQLDISTKFRLDMRLVSENSFLAFFFAQTEPIPTHFNIEFYPDKTVFGRGQDLYTAYALHVEATTLHELYPQIVAQIAKGKPLPIVTRKESGLYHVGITEYKSSISLDPRPIEELIGVLAEAYEIAGIPYLIEDDNIEVLL